MLARKAISFLNNYLLLSLLHVLVICESMIIFYRRIISWHLWKEKILKYPSKDFANANAYLSSFFPIFLFRPFLIIYLLLVYYFHLLQFKIEFKIYSSVEKFKKNFSSQMVYNNRGIVEDNQVKIQWNFLIENLLIGKQVCQSTRCQSSKRERRISIIRKKLEKLQE